MRLQTGPGLWLCSLTKSVLVSMISVHRSGLMQLPLPVMPEAGCRSHLTMRLVAEQLMKSCKRLVDHRKAWHGLCRAECASLCDLAAAVIYGSMMHQQWETENLVAPGYRFWYKTLKLSKQTNGNVRFNRPFNERLPEALRRFAVLQHALCQYFSHSCIFHCDGQTCKNSPSQDHSCRCLAGVEALGG